MRFTVWHVAAVGGLILATAAIWKGKVAEGQFLAVLVYLALGALVPAVAVPLGVVILFAMLMRGGGIAVSNWVTKLVGR